MLKLRNVFFEKQMIGKVVYPKETPSGTSHNRSVP